MSDWDRIEDLALRMQRCKDELAAIAAEAGPLVDRIDAAVLESAAVYVGEAMEQTGFLPLTHFNLNDCGEEDRQLVAVADRAICWSDELAS